MVQYTLKLALLAILVVYVKKNHCVCRKNNFTTLVLTFCNPPPFRLPLLKPYSRNTNRFFQQSTNARLTKHLCSRSPKVHGNEIIAWVRHLGNSPRFSPLATLPLCRGRDVWRWWRHYSLMSAANLRRWTATQLCSRLGGKVIGWWRHRLIIDVTYVVTS